MVTYKLLAEVKANGDCNKTTRQGESNVLKHMVFINNQMSSPDLWRSLKVIIFCQKFDLKCKMQSSQCDQIGLI